MQEEKLRKDKLVGVNKRKSIRKDAGGEKEIQDYQDRDFQVEIVFSSSSQVNTSIVSIYVGRKG